jgi:polysaccharide biosynthesis protein PslH
MKVAVVDWDITYPMNSGKRLRTLNLMLQLADEYDITYFSRGDGGSPEGKEAQQYLNDRGIETVFANVPLPRKSTWAYKACLATRVWANDPVAVEIHRSGKLKAAIREFAKGHHIDLWQVEWTPYLEMLPASHNLRSVICAHNIDSLIWQRYCETESNWLRNQLFTRQWKKFQRFERRVFNQATSVVAVSAEDAILLREDFGVKHVEVVENGVDVDHYRSVVSPRDPRELLFLGSLDWKPNLDALRILLDDILPRVQRAEPSARLTIVGRNPPLWLSSKAAAQANVRLEANVFDVRTYLSRAGMLVVPLRIGGGSRLKILEALANSLPVIASTVAAEGLRLTPDEDLKIADSSEDMTQGIVDWIRQPAHAAEIARRGFKVVNDHYSWSRIARHLASAWERTLQPATLVEQPC